jgi:hypothetical protein
VQQEVVGAHPAQPPDVAGPQRRDLLLGKRRLRRAQRRLGVVAEGRAQRGLVDNAPAQLVHGVDAHAGQAA